MDRVEISKNYAAACQRIIDENGDDYRKGCELIERIPVPENIHPMLAPINDLAYDIVADFRGDESDKRSWDFMQTKVRRFMANEWEPTTWWAMIVYGTEENGVLRHSYSLSIRRQGSVLTYESGDERLIEAAQQGANSIDEHQTDEWFMRALLVNLPGKVNDLLLQSTYLSEMTVPEGSKS